MKIGKVLKKLLKDRGYSQTKLANEIGCSPSKVSEWASDKYMPRHETLELIAKALNSTVAELLGDNRVLSKVDEELLEAAEGVPEETKRTVIDFFRFIKDRSS